MNYMRTLMTDLLRDESGQDLIEYALVAALIALGAVVAIGSLGNDISKLFNSVGTTLNSAIM